MGNTYTLPLCRATLSDPDETWIGRLYFCFQGSEISLAPGSDSLSATCIAEMNSVEKTWAIADV